MAEVKSFRGAGEFPLHHLIEIANNPNVAAVQIVTHWKPEEGYPEGFTTVGWTRGIKNGALLYGARSLQLEVDQRVLPHRHNQVEIDY